MGIDLLDLTFRIEKELGVTIPRDRWSELSDGEDITVERLHECIEAQLQVRDAFRTNIRLNEELWSRVQTAICRVTGLPDKRVQLSTLFHEVFPTRDLRAIWNELEEVSELRFPELSFSEWWLGLFGVTGVVSLYLGVVVSSLVGFQGLIILPVMFFLISAMVQVAQGWRSRARPGTRRLKDLYKNVLDCNLFQLRHNCGKLFLQDEVWSKLKRILVDALGIDDDEIVPSARLVADLGCC